VDIRAVFSPCLWMSYRREHSVVVDEVVRAKGDEALVIVIADDLALVVDACEDRGPSGLYTEGVVNRPILSSGLVLEIRVQVPRRQKATKWRLGLSLVKAYYRTRVVGAKSPRSQRV